MRLAEKDRNGNGFTIGEKVVELKKLDQSQLIKMERGDSLNKELRRAKTRPAFGQKGLFSVKMIRETLEKVAEMNTKKTVKGTWCCVCCDIWTTNEDGICDVCHI